MDMDYSAPGPNRERVRKMAADGLTTRQIAVALNISTQRVNKIKAKIRAAEQEQQEAAS